MPNLEKIKLEIGNPAFVLTVVAVDRFQGTHGPSVTFEGTTHAVTMSAATAEKQLGRHNLTPEQAIGKTFKFEKVAGGQSGFINVNPVAAVAAGAMTAALKQPPTAHNTQGAPNAPFDDTPVFDEDGEPVYEGQADEPPVPSLREATIVTAMERCMRNAERMHRAIEQSRMQTVDVGSGKSERMSDYVFDGNAVARLASTMFIALRV